MRFLSYAIASLLWAANAQAAGRPVLQVMVDPPRSANGELIKFKVLVRYEGNAPVRAPQFPPTNDWRIINSFDSNSVSSVLLNGRIVTKFQYEYTWLLRPLHTGKLTIPSMDLWVGTAHYQTDIVEVPVDRLPDGSQGSMPQLGNRNPNPHPTQPPDDDVWQGQMPQIPSQQDFAPPNRQTFFVRAEASNTKVYQGELITLSYVLYEKRPSITNPEINKFPDFKGFLKEELLVPKTLNRTPTQVQGETLYRSELIKYAVFPLKPGQLKIEPLAFKADYISNSVDDMIGNLMNGVMPPGFGPNFGQVVPMRKSTQAVVVESKPLPPAPPNAVFTGGVGQFKMEAQGPTGRLQVDQPFTVTLTITGSGNVKVIEEPPLKLPKSLEPYQTKNNYEFKEDATGFKSFEYLILPRAPGTVKIDPIQWTYFDPRKAQYVTLTTQPLEFTVEGASGGGPAATPNAPQAPTRAAPTWASAPTGAQHFVPTASIGDAWMGQGPWMLQAVMYAGAGILFWRRRQEESESDLFRRAPWEKTQRQILTKSTRPKSELAILVDQWMRERLAGHIRRTEIHSEASRDEFFDVLRSMLHVEHHRHLEALKKFWADLDLLRFTGKEANEAVSSKGLLDQAKKTLEPILKS